MGSIYLWSGEWGVGGGGVRLRWLEEGKGEDGWWRGKKEGVQVGRRRVFVEGSEGDVGGLVWRTGGGVC